MRWSSFADFCTDWLVFFYVYLWQIFFLTTHKFYREHLSYLNKTNWLVSFYYYDISQNLVSLKLDFPKTEKQLSYYSSRHCCMKQIYSRWVCPKNCIFNTYQTLYNLHFTIHSEILAFFINSAVKVKFPLYWGILREIFISALLSSFISSPHHKKY